ncbi:unnamed protein product [Phytophthora fragariaefolia]|uniref:Unnamed protein product n=1 Tax=Phytophthora fragariaefolia TaxID=1490495 RepID=A0A9W6U429_9STRA|nr:unnamed protein product [Phytophthora fragariaefolia]
MRRYPSESLEASATCSRSCSSTLKLGRATAPPKINDAMGRLVYGHLYRHVRRAQVERASEGNAIDRSSQSPDFNVLDLSLFSTLQTLQQTRRMNTVSSIVEAVEGAYKELRRKTLDNAFLTLMSVMEKCLEDEGGNQLQIPHIKKEKRCKAGEDLRSLPCSEAAYRSGWVASSINWVLLNADHGLPGGLTPYLQAGDIGIYKGFKDLLYIEINGWKESDKVEYTRFGNPRMPCVDTVCGWVVRAWRETEEATVMDSMEAAGFANEPTDWIIAKQDVYGSKLRERWADESMEDDDTDMLNLSVSDDALDDINLVDE